MRDKLASLPGLKEQPPIGSPGHAQLEDELTFAISCADPDNSKEGREVAARAVLRFMVARGYWPLGTQCKVTKNFTVKTKFPKVSA